MSYGRYFKESEFTCKCGCGQTKMDPLFIAKLNNLRHEYGKPMIVTSGYRCPNHPVEARKASAAPGMHTTGKAADIAVTGADAHRLLTLALEAGFRGIGVNQKGSGRFIHLDDRAQPTVWSY